MTICNLLAMLLMLGVVVRFSFVPSDRKRTTYMFWAIVGTILLGAISLVIANSLSSVRPLKYDEFVYQADGVLGFQPSFALGRFVAARPWLANTLMTAYGIAPIAVALVYAAYLWLGTQWEQFTVLKTFALNLLIAPAFYLIFPVSGPRFAFSRFPAEPGFIVPRLVSLNAAPNGVPSVHFSTALLILWFCWRWKLGRVLGSIYLVLILGATLASGQHYLLDLIAAVPYAIGVRWLASRRPRTSAESPAATLPDPTAATRVPNPQDAPAN